MPENQEFTMSLPEIRKWYRKVVKAVGTKLEFGVRLKLQGNYNADEEQDYIRIPFARGNRGFTGDGNGIEFVTETTTDLSVLEQTFKKMEDLGWNFHRDASTRVLVDDTHISLYEKFKLYRFCKAIEPIIFALVNNQRYNSSTSKLLPRGMAHLFDLVEVTEADTWETVARKMNTLRGVPFRAVDSSNFAFDNNANHWVNPFVTMGRGRWVAFNLFHSARNVWEATVFALIAHNIMRLVKYSTVEQLREIASQIAASETPEQAIEKLCAAIGLPALPPRSQRRLYELTDWLSDRRQDVEQASQIVVDQRVAVAQAAERHNAMFRQALQQAS